MIISQGSGTEIDGKKTLGETKKDLIELEKVKRDQEQQFKDSDKVKVRQIGWICLGFNKH